VGHKWTNRRGPKSTFVLFGPKADKRGCCWIVRFVPIATNAPQQIASLFDHIAGDTAHTERPPVRRSFRNPISCFDQAGLDLASQALSKPSTETHDGKYHI
jgi:hypothetical protein